MSNFYKVFFTITFDYAEKKNKVITKFFKSDIDISPNDIQENIDDNNIYIHWNKFAIEKSINDFGLIVSEPFRPSQYPHPTKLFLFLI